MFDQWFGSLPFRIKFLAVLLMTMVLALLLSALVFVTLDLRNQKNEMVQEFSSMAQLVAQRSQAAVMFLDERRAGENLSSFERLQGALFACLYAHSQTRVLARWPDIDGECRTVVQHQPRLVQDQFEWAVAVQTKTGEVGVLTLRGSFSGVYQRAGKMALSLLFIGTLASLAAYFVSRPLQRRLYLPIRNLGEVARSVALQGDYAVRAEKTSTDELGDAVDAFNNMLERLEEDKVALEKLAYYDTLTGLANRRLFMEKLARAVAHSRLHKKDFGLVFIDLDNFKWVNDNLGHDRGDLLLQVVARRLSMAVRPMDCVARLGGDEFTIILLELASVAEGEQLCQAVLAALTPTIALGSHGHQAGASLGLAVSDGYRVGVDEVLKQADLAVYEAKAAGKNTYRVYRQ